MSKFINEKLSQELFSAVEANDEEKLQQLLLLDDVDVNVIDGGGDTPLHNACRSNFKGCVKLLLARDDVDINIQNGRGMTPFHVLSFSGDEDLFALFLEYPELDVNRSDDLFRYTSLHAVCVYNNIEKVALLLKRPDIDISLRDFRLDKPLDTVKKCYEETKLQGDEIKQERFLKIIDMLENFKPQSVPLTPENQEKLSTLSPNDIKMPENKAFLDECAKMAGLPQIFVGLAHKQQSALLDVYATKIRANDKYSEAIGQIVYATHKCEKEKRRQASAGQIKGALCQNQRQ